MPTVKLTANIMYASSAASRAVVVGTGSAHAENDGRIPNPLYASAAQHYPQSETETGAVYMTTSIESAGAATNNHPPNAYDQLAPRGNDVLEQNENGDANYAVVAEHDPFADSPAEYAVVAEPNTHSPAAGLARNRPMLKANAARAGASGAATAALLEGADAARANGPRTMGQVVIRNGSDSTNQYNAWGGGGGGSPFVSNLQPPALATSSNGMPFAANSQPPALATSSNGMPLAAGGTQVAAGYENVFEGLPYENTTSLSLHDEGEFC
jgi:hypothetical protein